MHTWFFSLQGFLGFLSKFTQLVFGNTFLNHGSHGRYIGIKYTGIKKQISYCFFLSCKLRCCKFSRLHGKGFCFCRILQIMHLYGCNKRPGWQWRSSYLHDSTNAQWPIYTPKLPSQLLNELITYQQCLGLDTSLIIWEVVLTLNRNSGAWCWVCIIFGQRTLILSLIISSCI